jgi:uncharacterized protein (TIGR02444 family)
MAGRAGSNPLWSYSLRLYKQPGVAPACIALQDRRGVDVNVLLFCLWAATASARPLPAKTMTLAAGLSRLWTANVVGQLRHARRFLKPLELPKLRARVAEIELGAERVEQDLLVQLAPRRSGKAPKHGAAQRAAANLAAYFSRLRVSLGAGDVGHVVAILVAAFPDLDPAAARRWLR